VAECPYFKEGDKMNTKAEKTEIRKPYRKPALTVHGTVTELTRGGETGQLEGLSSFRTETHSH
jgi:hypothetical protein